MNLHGRDGGGFATIAADEFLPQSGHHSPRLEVVNAQARGKDQIFQPFQCGLGLLF